MAAETSATKQSAANTAARADRILVLADDLTGACDASAAFVAAGHGVRVWLGEKSLFAADETVQAFNTASRALPADEAAAAVAQAAAAMATDAGTIRFKKIDSAGRGPIGAELLAAGRAFGTRGILFAPGFPAAGRTVRGGVLEVCDASGQVVTLDLRELFPASLRDEIALVTHGDEIAGAFQSGKAVLVCDSLNQEELNALAHAAQPLADLLYAGSAGLARAIANLHGVDAQPAAQPTALRTLVISGTPHPVTKMQLEHLEKRTQVDGASAGTGVQILRVECVDGDEGRIREAFHALDAEALILTGGDTALFACQALGAHSILLKGEFAAGIPWGTLEGGEAHGRTVVTKSGGFGSPSALNDLIDYLSGGA